jgi:CRISPR-associated Csx2 family protein
MGRKVFISVLGTGFYGPCKYQKDSFISEESRFIQKATLNYIGTADWSKDDIGYILLTDLARTINWNEPVNGIKYNRLTDKEETYHGLQYEVEKMALPFKIKDVSIPDGKNDEEMWGIFEKLYDLIEEDDELYIDLTHSFRYIPMLVMVFSNYVKFLRKANVVYLSYGNYEARDKDTNIAPIVDLLPLSSLQDWTAAADQYLNTGSIDKLRSLYLPTVVAKLKDSLGQDESAKKMRGFISHLESVVMDRLTCQGREIIKSTALNYTLNDLAYLQDVHIPEPFKPLLEKMSISLSEFDGTENVSNGLKTAKWCLGNGLYQQCVTLLQETVICLICESAGLEWTNLIFRETVSSAFAIVSMKIPEEKWKLQGADDEEKAQNKELIKSLILNEKLLSVKNEFATLTEIRNQYNHGGMLENVKFNATKMINKITNLLTNIIEKLGGDVNQSNDSHISGMLINLTSHPSDRWDEKQKEAARIAYGDIVDIPFPTIQPETDEEYVTSLVDDYMDKIKSTANGKSYAVHVMGEMTFTVAMVERLMAVGIDCVASTTERIVEDLPDGRKLTKFDFVRFRHYI